VFTTSWGAFVLAALKALPALISLISAMKASADAKRNQGIGYDQAVADGFAQITKQLQAADEAVSEARARQAAHPDSDDGRDTSFRRD
jgi:hypothetical protein